MYASLEKNHSKGINNENLQLTPQRKPLFTFGICFQLFYCIYANMYQNVLSETHDVVSMYM